MRWLSSWSSAPAPRALISSAPADCWRGGTQQVLGTSLEVEMDEHLGYAKHERRPEGSGNSRNGARSKTVLTDVGPIDVAVPRDRDATFEPKIVKKRQRRLDGVDAMVSR